ncbi:MAG TPA: hypothetical protein ENN56_02115 [Firmicutes bacterium]|nr:hypothetical protein [Bacillota bacterium]
MSDRLRSDMMAFTLNVFVIAVVVFLPVSTSAEPTLRVFYTANVKGFIDPCGCPGAPAGGITRRATFFRERADVPSIKLDGGEILGNDTPIDRMRTIYLLRAMQEMGYRTIGVGPRDFMYGREFIEFIAQEFQFTLVNANVVDENGAPIFAPYAIEEVSETGLLGMQRSVTRIGILNVIGEDRTPLTIPTNPPVYVTDPVTAASRIVDELRSEVDLIVLMANVNPETLNTLTQIDGVDIILMTRLTRIPGEYVVVNDKTAIGYSTIEGRGIGQIDVTLRSGELVDVKGSLTMLFDRIPEDRTMLRIREEFENWKDQYIDELPSP